MTGESLLLLPLGGVLGWWLKAIQCRFTQGGGGQ